MKRTTMRRRELKPEFIDFISELQSTLPTETQSRKTRPSLIKGLNEARLRFAGAGFDTLFEMLTLWGILHDTHHRSHEQPVTQQQSGECGRVEHGCPQSETLQTILTGYPEAKSEPLEGHELAKFIRYDAETAVQQALGELGAGLVVEGSPGQGQWAAVPWISVFDPAITTSATRGYYVVYLFHAYEPVVHLSLNQGTTAVREEFAGKAREVLADRAEFMRKRVAEFGALLASSAV